MKNEFEGIIIGSLICFMISYVIAGIIMIITYDPATAFVIGLLSTALYMTKWWFNITKHYEETNVWTFR